MSLIAVAPMVIVLITACVVLLWERFGVQRPQHHQAFHIAMGGASLALAVSLGLWSRQGFAFNQMVAVDGISAFSHLVILVGLSLTILISAEYLRQFEIERGEFYALLLLSTVGMLVMVSASDLLVLFLGLEMMSIALYVLTGFTTRQVAAIEASLKYLLIGAFATGFLLYGIAFVYGGAGTTKLPLIAHLLAQGAQMQHRPFFVTGLALLSIGLAFKIGTVPFHQWVPDVYEGAPTAVTAFMAAAAKVAAFAALLRVLPQGFPTLHPWWGGSLALLAVATMLVGNLIALTQSNLKRLLAYSSIAHAGYLLVGVTASNTLGMEAVLFYGLVYALMTIGSFAVIIVLGERFREHLELDEYRGLATTNPFLAGILAVMLFSLAGLPPFGGFFAKYYVFLAAVEAGYTWLVVVGVLCSLVSVYYYLRVVRLMFMEPADLTIRSAPSPIARAALWVSAVGVLWAGVSPNLFSALSLLAVGNRAW